PELQFKVGQFKEPYSQEELVSAPYLDYAERSLVQNLVISYSPGVQLHGQLFQGAVQYQLAAMNGKGFLTDNTVSTPEGFVRLRFYPFKSMKNKWLTGLAFGGAGTHGTTLRGNSFTGLMQDRALTFFKSETINGAVLRANAELTWIVGPAALRAEYDQTNQFR